MRTKSAARRRVATILFASAAVVGTLVACTSGSQGQVMQPSTPARTAAPAPTTAPPSVPTPMPSRTEKPVPIGKTTGPAPKAQRHESPDVERPTAAHVRDADCVDDQYRPVACTDLRPVRLHFGAVRPSHAQPGQHVTVEGTVTLPGGAPAVGARVSVYRSPTPRVESSEIRLASGRTDANGHVSLHVVAPKRLGDWPLLVEAESPTPRFWVGYESILLTVARTAVPTPNPVAPEQVRVSCTADPVQVFHYAQVSCQVRSQSNVALANEPVYVERGPGMFVPLGSGTTDALGRVTGEVYDVDTRHPGKQFFGVQVRPREARYDWVRVWVTRTSYGTATYFQAVTATAAPSTIDAGRTSTIQVTVTRRFDGKARVDGPVELHDAATGSLVATAITDASGAVSFAVSPATTTTYDVVAPETPDLAYGRGSTQVTVTVAPPAVADAPTITGVSPRLLVGGDTVTLTGQNLARATSVDFGDFGATSYTVVSDTEIEAIVPSWSTAVGATHLAVTTAAGTSSATADNAVVLTSHAAFMYWSGSSSTESAPSFAGESWSDDLSAQAWTPDENAGAWTEVSGLSGLGLAIDSSGNIAGTPDASGIGDHTAVVRYTDSFGLTTDLTVQLHVLAATTPEWDANISVTGYGGLPGACPGRQYELDLTQFLVVKNDFQEGTFEVVSGALPSGMTLDATTGVLAGNPGAASNSPVTLRYAQGGGKSADVDTAFVVAAMFC